RAFSRWPQVGVRSRIAAMHLLSGAASFGLPIGSHAVMHLSPASPSSRVHPADPPATAGAETEARGEPAIGVDDGGVPVAPPSSAACNAALASRRIPPVRVCAVTCLTSPR